MEKENNVETIKADINEKYVFIHYVNVFNYDVSGKKVFDQYKNDIKRELGKFKDVLNIVVPTMDDTKIVLIQKPVFSFKKSEDTLCTRTVYAHYVGCHGKNGVQRDALLKEYREFVESQMTEVENYVNIYVGVDGNENRIEKLL